MLFDHGRVSDSIELEAPKRVFNTLPKYEQRVGGGVGGWLDG